MLAEKDRPLINGMLSAISARDGRFIALSVQGPAPFTAEMLERRGQPGIAIHHYAAPEGCRIDDETAWLAANPGLGNIKSYSYMVDLARRVMATPADQSAFRVFDLNQATNPSAVRLCDPADWRSCETEDLPDRSGPCVLGVDLGGSASMTAAAACWPDTGRVEVWTAFPDTPSLADRAEADGCRGLYEQMQERGELRIYPGRVTPVSTFLQDVAVALSGQRVRAVGADRYRKAETIQAFEQAKVRWPITWRGTGASKKADGSPRCPGLSKAHHIRQPENP